MRITKRQVKWDNGENIRGGLTKTEAYDILYGIQSVLWRL